MPQSWRPRAAAHSVASCVCRIVVSISHLERRAVLRPRAPVIVDARGGDVGVAEPFLHLGDVGLVVERIGRGGRAQRVRADFETRAQLSRRAPACRCRPA